jgi:SCY1-like protein 3
MGAEGSSFLNSVTIDSSPILSTEDWALHHAQQTDGDEAQLSVFIDSGHGTAGHGRLEVVARHLARHRHPALLRRVAWLPGPTAHLFTEKASPLAVVRRQQAPQAVCLGLQDLALALQFLHSTAGCYHGSLTLASVFVTPHGRWRLAGLETLAKLQLVEQEIARDVQALGLLVTQLLADSTDREALAFREFASSRMLVPDVSRLPSLAAVLAQPYFQQSYLTVVGFLRDLPLHPLPEREAFMLSLPDLLRDLPPAVVGLQLVPLLLGRFVLMDPTAREKLLPHLLCPQESEELGPAPPGLQPVLPLAQWRESVVPQLRTMFLVPDTQVRLVLLRHFPQYCRALDRDTLADEVLPALLQGLRDTDPALVAATLRALAELVPILGPHIVIGSNRTKIFSDGSPGRGPPVPPEVSLRAGRGPGPPGLVCPQEGPGEEAFDWQDWSDQDEAATAASETEEPVDVFAARSSALASNVEMMIKNVEDLDIMKLDVKVSKAKTHKVEDVDFFADMKPEIVKPASALEEFEEKLKTRSSPERRWLPAEGVAGEGEGGDWGEASLDWEQEASPALH